MFKSQLGENPDTESTLAHNREVVTPAMSRVSMHRYTTSMYLDVSIPDNAPS